MIRVVKKGRLYEIDDDDINTVEEFNHIKATDPERRVEIISHRYNTCKSVRVKNLKLLESWDGLSN